MILIEFYDSYAERTFNAAVSHPDAAYAVCKGLDNNDCVIQWRITGAYEDEYRWYKESLWKKLKINLKDWVYN